MSRPGSVVNNKPDWCRIDVEKIKDEDRTIKTKYKFELIDTECYDIFDMLWKLSKQERDN